ncbi:protein MpC3H37 [Marchantia polymorpha subsp. ruderalis]|uniref:C3H1-type domain-containing protein n=2 Tax=Marchantia polymorpha TaxID=3197 RepID=A0A176VV72_MARPO|nr:hypothetical protein AXG93_1528s1210 [Marchantia polymorpha subsp. ruderalis]PTQ26797.1 hypothetical protein MARPO_0359s0001 [Marchantia polymorpha]BBN19304.1 hypothetical protein Mp_8g09500 [Marchantia polymorpha subsp. ruderalis]|eukprot:PTQ26797.1 hypothetical protein MARPO_0359s0001 [Marchantia polymorpha]
MTQHLSDEQLTPVWEGNDDLAVLMDLILQNQLQPGMDHRTLPRVEIMYAPFPESVKNEFNGFNFPEAATIHLATTVQATSIIKVPIYAAFGGAIIGKRGVNAKRICNEAGLRKLSIQNHSAFPHLKYLIMEGSVKVLCAAIRRVNVLIKNETLAGKLCDWRIRHAFFKTQLCRKFVSGFCRRGNLCDYAHGEHEIRAVGTYFPKTDELGSKYTE